MAYSKSTTHYANADKERFCDKSKEATANDVLTKQDVKKSDKTPLGHVQPCLVYYTLEGFNSSSASDSQVVLKLWVRLPECLLICKMGLRKMDCRDGRVDGIDSGSCPTTAFGLDCVNPFCSATAVNQYDVSHENRFWG